MPKIKSLRQTLNLEEKIIYKSKASGAGTEDLYISPIPWLDHLRRLKETSKPQNLQKSTADEVIMDLVEDVEETEAPISASYSQAAKRHHMIPGRKRDIRVDNLQQSIGKLDTLVNRCGNPTEADDELDCFGKYIIRQLRNLPKRKRKELQKEIQDKIMEAIMDECDSDD